LDCDIKIFGSDDDKGLLEFDRLRVLTTSTKAIATKALMLVLRAFSKFGAACYCPQAMNVKSIAYSHKRRTMDLIL